jgi:hypothetical protein
LDERKEQFHSEGGYMNVSTVINYLQGSSIRQLIIISYLFLAIVIVCYNWLYLYHSLHVTAKHMGLNTPVAIRQTIKISIMLSLVTAILSIFLLMTGRY